MTEYELDQFCKRNPDCGCVCMKCPAYGEYHYSQLGYDEEEYQE